MSKRIAHMKLVVVFVKSRITTSLGKVKSVAANSCKQIKEALITSCHNVSGLYWVWKDNSMQVCRPIFYHESYS